MFTFMQVSTDTCINGYAHRFGVPVLALSLTCVDPVLNLCLPCVSHVVALCLPCVNSVLTMCLPCGTVVHLLFALVALH